MDSAANAPILPTIIIHTSHPIDSTSVTFGSNYADSAADFTVVLVRKLSADAVSGQWDNLTELGTYSIPNPTELRFAPSYDLDWNTEYVVVVKGLVVLDSMHGPQSAPADTVVFRTVPGPHRLVSASHGDGRFCQGDTISLTFNRRLDSSATALGELAELQKVVVDSSMRWGDSVLTVPVAASLSIDSTSLLLTPTGTLDQSYPYRVLVHVSRLSGDSADDRQIVMFAHERHGVTVRPVDLAGNRLSSAHNMTPDTAAAMFHPGDTVRLRTAWIADYEFVRWSSPDVPAIDSLEADTATFVQCCGDVVIDAVYRPIPYDTLMVNAADSGGYAQVYSWSKDSLGWHGEYAARSDDGFFIIARPDSGSRFKKWTSSAPSVDGRTDIAIKVGSLDGWITPVFEDEDKPGNYAFCGSFLSDYASQATLSASCHNTEQPESRSITCSIVEPSGAGACYRIMGRIDPDGTIHDWTENPRTQDSFGSVTDDNPVPNVVWSVETYLYTLDVSVEDEDGHPVPNDARVEVARNTRYYQCGEVATLTAVDAPSRGVTFKEWQPGGSTSKVLLVSMDEDKNYTAVFGSTFAVTKIYWFVGDDPAELPFNIEQTVTNVQILPLTPVNSTYMMVEFNQPVDTTTVNAGTFWIDEIGERIDGEPLQRYNHLNLAFRTWYGTTQFKVRLENYPTGLAVRKLQTLNVHLRGDIKSAIDEPLGNPGIHVAITENPDVRWAITATVTYDQDPGACGELFGAFNAARYTRGSIIDQFLDSLPGSGQTESVCAPPNSVPDFSQDIAFVAQGIGKDERLEIAVTVLDEDNSSVLANMSSIVQAVSAGIGVKIPPYTVVGILGLLGAAIGPHLDGSWLQNMDDLVGKAGFDFGAQDLWGHRASLDRRSRIDRTCMFRLDVTLE